MKNICRIDMAIKSFKSKIMFRIQIWSNSSCIYYFPSLQKSIFIRLFDFINMLAITTIFCHNLCIL